MYLSSLQLDFDMEFAENGSENDESRPSVAAPMDDQFQDQCKIV